METPSDRSPGPDGFSGLFFKLAWDVIAEDLLAALEQIHRGNFRNFQRLNLSMLVLPPKGESFGYTGISSHQPHPWVLQDTAFGWRLKQGWDWIILVFIAFGCS
jgi:hypothetical protein